VVSGDGRGRRHDVHDLAFDIGLRHGVVLAPLVIEDRVLADLLALEIDRDGVPL